MMNLTKMIFFSILTFSTLFSISTNSWINCWMGMELNLYAFIVLIFKQNMYNLESTIKYFIIQSITSMFFLIAIMMYLQTFSPFNSLLVNLSLLMKLNSSPFHYWGMNMILGLTWQNIIIFLTWQKIIPMILLFYNFNFTLMMIFIILNSLFGSIEGLNQVSLKKIILFSSINHLSWMLMIFYMNENLWMMYFLIYSSILMIITSYNYMMNNLKMNQMYSMKITHLNNFFLLMNLLSLGGLPPFLGFFPKWITIKFMLMNNLYFINLLMILCSLLTLFFYLRLFYSSSFLMMFKIKWMHINNTKNLFLLNILSFSSMSFLILSCLI
uniref:NADH dehydrogenase subunit 2 n=1 Tax=Chimarra paramonorum TaxID=2484723 RepID=UPI0022DCE084|nr:NADH dehydrogenase subunit 2 [Chimarra paramonorum]UZZ43844.1 NADH dehydrogenase subunit 2 [Chimarra paramonorum]